MANKRMFSKQITTSDAFVEMPVSSQLLYFHLNMEADDDGFVANPKRMIRMLNVGEDDFKILIAKRFILPFESGVVVIKHWLLHNAVRKDMYKETQYLEEKNMLKIKDNGVYTEVRNESVTSSLHRLDKDRLDKVKLDKNTPEQSSETLSITAGLIYGEFKNIKLTDEEYKKLILRFGEKNVGILIEELSVYMASKKTKYLSHYAVLLNWGKRKIQEHQNKGQKNRSIVKV